jgi:hypothetical protein
VPESNSTQIAAIMAANDPNGAEAAAAAAADPNLSWVEQAGPAEKPSGGKKKKKKRAITEEPE